jgi:hypothetical protein
LISHDTMKTRKRDKLFRAFVVSWLVLAAPRAALACPVCFGNGDSPMAVAAKMGVIAMLVVVAGVLGGFASFFIYLMRRAKRVAEQEARSNA